MNGTQESIDLSNCSVLFPPPAPPLCRCLDSKKITIIGFNKRFTFHHIFERDIGKENTESI